MINYNIQVGYTGDRSLSNIDKEELGKDKHVKLIYWGESADVNSTNSDALLLMLDHYKNDWGIQIKSCSVTVEEKRSALDHGNPVLLGFRDRPRHFILCGTNSCNIDIMDTNVFDLFYHAIGGRPSDSVEASSTSKEESSEGIKEPMEIVISDKNIILLLL